MEQSPLSSEEKNRQVVENSSAWFSSHDRYSFSVFGWLFCYYGMHLGSLTTTWAMKDPRCCDILYRPNEWESIHLLLPSAFLKC